MLQSALLRQFWKKPSFLIPIIILFFLVWSAFWVNRFGGIKFPQIFTETTKKQSPLSIKLYLIILSLQSINVRDIYTSSRWLGEGQQRDEWIALLETEVKLAIETGDFNTARVVIEKLIKDITILESTAFDNNKPLDKNGDKGGFIKGTGLVDAWEEPLAKLSDLSKDLEKAK